MKCCQSGARGFGSPRKRFIPRLRAVGAVLAVLVVSGCAPGNAGAAGAAEDFRRAVADGDPSTACSMLSAHTREKAAAETSCEDQLESLQLPTDGAAQRTESYGREAMVEFEDDTVFLTVSGSGWQVTGAGCEQRAKSPYDCEVGG